MTTRALRAQAAGEPAEVLEVIAEPLPEPGPGQVLIQVRAAPVHPSDLHTVRGRYGTAPAFPLVPGTECVGTIAALGAGVTGLRIGDRVITLGVPGTWREHLVADSPRVLPIPDAISDSAACQLIINPLTAWLLTAGVREGETLVQTAAGSTVGKLVLELARHRGFRTVNVVRRRAAVAEIQALGDEVICTEDEELPARLAALGGFTTAIDCVAGEVGAQVFSALAPSGELVVYGALSTHRQTDPAALTIPIPANALIFGTKRVRGFWLYRWLLDTPPAQVRDTLGEVIGLVAKGVLTIPEGQPFGLDRAADAVRHAEAPAHGGKPYLSFV